MDKGFWQTVIDNNYVLPQGADVVALTNELLGYLGSPDPDLRDTFAYSILARWMLRDGMYSADDLLAITLALLPNLVNGIGQQDSDSVFLRSYSVLVLSL